MRAIPFLMVSGLLAAGPAIAAGSPALITVRLSPVYSLAVPAGTEARTRDGTLIATLGSTGDAAAFGSAAGQVIARQQDVVLLPTPGQGDRKIEIGSSHDAEYARRINAMSRLEFIMHQSIMKRLFLGDLAKKPGRHAAETSAITFHDRYRGIFYLSLSETSEAVVGQLTLDVFRGDALYSSSFHWTQPSIEDRDALVDRIIDSVQVADATYSVVINAFEPEFKIRSIKAIREETGLGLADAKRLLEATPSAIRAGLTRSEAEAVAARLRAQQMTVELEPEP